MKGVGWQGKGKVLIPARAPLWVPRSKEVYLWGPPTLELGQDTRAGALGVKRQLSLRPRRPVQWVCSGYSDPPPLLGPQTPGNTESAFCCPMEVLRRYPGLQLVGQLSEGWRKAHRDACPEAGLMFSVGRKVNSSISGEQLEGRWPGLGALLSSHKASMTSPLVKPQGQPLGTTALTGAEEVAFWALWWSWGMWPWDQTPAFW